jgi:transposase-like protein
MIHKKELHCPHCQSDDLVKNGKAPNGTQRWCCNTCKKSFRFNYRYNACKQGVKERIIELTLNSSGVRDISRVLKINKNTVCAVLKKNAQSEPLFFDSERTPKTEEIGS